MAQLLEKESLHGCKVTPITPKAISHSDIPNHEIDNDGCAIPIIGIVTFIVTFIVFKSRADFSSTVIFSLVAAAVVTYFIRDFLRTTRLEEIIKKRNEALLLESVQEAERTASSLKSSYQNSLAMLKKIEEKRNVLLKTIVFTRSEFEQTAYSSFWDSVERGLSQLADCGQEIQGLAQEAEWYKKTLTQREHNFPPFPVTPEMMPNFQTAVQELYGVIRLGETNINFSLIYEQIKTRQVLIRGFGNLDALIKGLGGQIQDSVNTLKDILSKMRK